MRCYNIGCGKTFSGDENTAKSCVFHPEAPVFHDGKKGWQCCGRFSSDFSTCLNTPGCQVGYHNPEKPPEPVKPQIDPKYDVDVVVVNPIEKKQERPSGDEEMVDLSIDVNPNVRTEIDKKLESSRAATALTNDSASAGASASDSPVPRGTACKNAACTRTYESSETNKEVCLYHSGEAVFHEGMKFWTCCLRRTSDFDAFMAQQGCSSGRHVWRRQAASAPLRHDWFQSPGTVTVTLYARLVRPESAVIRANSIKLSIAIEYECGEGRYEKTLELSEEIDPRASRAKIHATKLEIVLKKSKPFSWASLEFPALPASR